MATVYTSDTLKECAVISVEYSGKVERDFGSANQRPSGTLSQGTLPDTNLSASLSYIDYATKRVFSVTITGTPTVAGTFQCVVSFNKVGADATVWRVYVKVNEGEPPEIIVNDLSDADVNNVYSEVIFATGTEPITWSIVDGTLPTGLTLDSETGVISGTPVI